MVGARKVFVPLLGALFAGLTLAGSTVAEATAHYNVPPVRTFTSVVLAEPSLAVAIDGSIAVGNLGSPSGSIAVFGAGATGDAQPDRLITGSSTGLNDGGPTGIALGPNSDIYVSLYPVAPTSSGSIKVFSWSATGDVAAARTITGPNTGLKYVTGVAVSPDGTIYATNSNQVTVFPPGADGDVTPVRVISGPSLSGPSRVAVSTSGDIYVANFNTSTITVYGPGSDSTPVRTISGAYVQGPYGLAIDALGSLYVANANPSNIAVFASGANGAAIPLRTIGGSETGIAGPKSVALHQGYMFVANGYPGASNPPSPYSIGVFSAGRPMPPTNVTAVGSNAAVKVSWKAPTDDGGSPIVEYRAIASPGGRGCTSTTTSCTVTGLTNGVRYTFRVTAKNGFGTSDASAPSADVIPATVPSKVQTVTTRNWLNAGFATLRVVSVGWTAPTNNGGAAVSNYQYRYSLDSGKTWVSWADSGGRKAVAIPNLSRTRAYYVQVRAINRVGASLPALVVAKP